MCCPHRNRYFIGNASSSFAPGACYRHFIFVSSSRTAAPAVL
jgi:hypothetical protein